MASNSGRPPLGYANNGQKYSASNLEEISIGDASTPAGALRGAVNLKSNKTNKANLDLRRQMNSEQPYENGY